LKEKGLHVFKAFSIAERKDLEATQAYEGTCDYFLFDSKTLGYGGSGKQFNWAILENYTGKTPFFLSGGIGPDDVEKIKAFNHPKLVGIDVNSQFEIRPAHKNAALLQTFIQALK